MTAIEELQAHEGPSIEWTVERYQDLCNEVLTLPAEEQSAFDEAILYFVYQGKAIVLPPTPCAEQGQGL